MRFKYNGNVYETPNLEKKLKRMKIKMEDIEILPDCELKKEKIDNIPEWKGKIKCEYVNDKGEILISIYKDNPPNEKMFLNEKWTLLKKNY